MNQLCKLLMLGVGICVSSSALAVNVSQDVDLLDSLWSRYKFSFIKAGTVTDPERGGLTTSEGQSYALLRSVWSNDPQEFEIVWSWTKLHLQGKKEKVFAWKWHGRVIDSNNASDADTDIALALILASRRFKKGKYEQEALLVLQSLWDTSVKQINGQYYMTAGNWAKAGKPTVIHVGYLAPGAYETFAGVDFKHPWKRVVFSSYELIRTLLSDKNAKVLPEEVRLDDSGKILKLPGHFGYDLTPLFFRVALDKVWFHRRESQLRRDLVGQMKSLWQRDGRIFDSYDLSGNSLSGGENPSLYASLYALAVQEDGEFATALLQKKIRPYLDLASKGLFQKYYPLNWLWFSRALSLSILPSYDEVLAFLRPFDFEGFLASFPAVLFFLMLGLYTMRRVHPVFTYGFYGAAIMISGRYLTWRALNTLNFVEAFGPFISISLLVAEGYTLFTLILLTVQLGLSKCKGRETPELMKNPPSVDVFIPIYSEPLEILSRTVMAAQRMHYEKKKVFVLDDSKGDEVEELCRKMNVNHIRGPRKQGKAGNLNNALKLTSGELILVLDTDHIPLRHFLTATVPHFCDPKLGFVQTPHHFYNEDVFQRAFRSSKRICNEQDMFNHAIQSAKDSWGGAIFAGSGAVFRRAALEELGGFLLMSITEDIHTSQHLHAKGWKSVFVNKILAIGLSAETLSSHLIQRKRWMQGCLQIFFKDNPLFTRGLPLRHRIGYFAAHLYFFFPVFRLVFYLTPLYFLFFHFHPLFANVSELMGYLVPFLVALPLLSKMLLPAWPRMVWGTVFEYSLAFPLMRGMLDLLLPKSLAFKVTPKGITTSRRVFDFESSQLTLLALVVCLAAICKGWMEFSYFGIERDAYFLNLLWATSNAFFLGVGVWLAWERPQRRREHRVFCHMHGTIEAESGDVIPVVFKDISAGGARITRPRNLPERGVIKIPDLENLFLRYETVKKGAYRWYQKSARLRFDADTHQEENERFLKIFSLPTIWETRFKQSTRSETISVMLFFRGLVGVLALALSCTANASLSEQWYLSRAESNMEIKNYRAAIEAYERVTEINPTNQTAMKRLGFAYEFQGFTDKSVSQFDRYLEKFPEDSAVAFKQAQTLTWSRYNYRRKDALRYFEQGLRRENNTKMRLKYAALLGEDRTLLSKAIVEYEAVLKNNPMNRDSHLGLARAYAWNGKRDLAYFHLKKAQDLGSPGQLSALRQDLRAGRETELSAGVQTESVPSKRFEKMEAKLFAQLKQELGAFSTLKLKAGPEYLATSRSSVSGLFVEPRIEMRMNGESTVVASGSVHTFGGSNPDFTLFGGAFFQNGNVKSGFWAARSFISDSFASVVGVRDGYRETGSSRLYSTASRVDWNLKPVQVSLEPALGFVTQRNANSNFFASVKNGLVFEIGTYRAVTFSLTNTIELTHFGYNAEILGGGYYSPEFLFEEIPRVELGWTFSNNAKLGVNVGPVVHWVHEHGMPSNGSVGVDTAMGFSHNFGRSFSFEARLAWNQIEDSMRFTLFTSGTYRF